jgi:transcriptional regulator with XRE-family HTH domain
MMLSQRVKDYRYSLGWGPDELARRAAVSRTAIFNIETGRTELPRAATLRRIAAALGVPMETLLGGGGSPGPIRSFGSQREARDWTSETEWGAAATAQTQHRARHDEFNDSRFAFEYVTPHESNSFGHKRELASKLHELLESPLGDAMAGILEAMHRLLPETCLNG